MISTLNPMTPVRFGGFGRRKDLVGQERANAQAAAQQRQEEAIAQLMPQVAIKKSGQKPALTYAELLKGIADGCRRADLGEFGPGQPFDSLQFYNDVESDPTKFVHDSKYRRALEKLQEVGVITLGTEGELCRISPSGLVKSIALSDIGRTWVQRLSQA